MADFTDKAALGTHRINPSSMVPGATGNAPQNGVSTQTVSRNRQLQALANQLQGGTAGAGATGTAQSGTLAPPSAYKVRLPNGQETTVDWLTPMSTGQMLAQDLRNAPHISKRQDELGANTAPSKFAKLNQGMGSEVMNHIQENPGLMNRLMSNKQSELPSETQQMLPSKRDKKGGYKKEDFQLLSDVFKTLSER